ncbi:endolytic transglycosylase MltG [Exilibacterium tricleocarpae]|uniref:Endolytic murein transglycosylase n=1 Tax=Exilibacterium tricleocarpae TaxID=2591008 RepID=A0A545T8D9_9GAMM|nr:endolytic transglycosylase MltG [Exilibacterium tricleocarpae]TQV73490.1 endolytic transglycosylase MltG [Exilibacterium tricleocarpae]
MRLSVALLLLLLAAGAGLGWCLHWLKKPLPLAEAGLSIELKPGDSLVRVAHRLRSEGVLHHPQILVAYGRLTGATGIKVGEYKVAPGTSPRSLLEQLVRGDVVSYQVTLVEGWTYAQALAALHAESRLTAQLADLSVERQLEVLDMDVDHPEGWFFPDTYRFTRGMSDVDILRQAHRRMRDLLEREWAARAPGLPYANAYEALIMASIVERETGQPAERRQIAGVFVRRLQNNMRLQTDPTIIYGLGSDFDGNIRRRHLRQATPYNTYVIRGLPPTPIALPGREAIYATLHPDDSEALYFVAKGDGSHQFSNTLEEHNKAVRRYQIVRRKKDYRSAPQPKN